MTSLAKVYRKFGETSEAAQLLEFELATLLFEANALGENLHKDKNPTRALEILEGINKRTLGQLLQRITRDTEIVLDEELLLSALDTRNHLAHSFYSKHNFRRNSDQGRTAMWHDLDRIHDTLLAAYKAVMLVSGIDLDKLQLTESELPTTHLPLK